MEQQVLCNTYYAQIELMKIVTYAIDKEKILSKEIQHKSVLVSSPI
jgi:hypothetical protein